MRYFIKTKKKNYIQAKYTTTRHQKHPAESWLKYQKKNIKMSRTRKGSPTQG